MGAEPKVEVPSGTDTTPRSSSVPVETVRISIADPKAEEEKVRLLYAGLLRIKRKDTQESPISYQQFAKYIADQTQSIRARHNCSAVAFTIALEEDAIRFTAVAENP